MLGPFNQYFNGVVYILKLLTCTMYIVYKKHILSNWCNLFSRKTHFHWVFNVLQLRN